MADHAPLITTVENAILAAEHARGAAATGQEREALAARLAALRDEIGAMTDRYGLFAVDPKEPGGRQRAAAIKARFTPEELMAAEEAVGRLGTERDAATARLLLLDMVPRIRTVQAGVALCEDANEDDDIHVYAPGGAGEAAKRGALVFRDEEAPEGWLVRLRFWQTTQAERRTAPGVVARPTREKCLQLGRSWVAEGSIPGG